MRQANKISTPDTLCIYSKKDITLPPVIATVATLISNFLALVSNISALVLVRSVP